MALPTLLRQTDISTDRETVALLREQKDAMIKLSNALTGNNSFQKVLRKDMQDMKKEMASNMQGFSEIKKYFEKQKTPLEQKTIEIKEDKKENIFSKTLAKLLGKEENSKDTEEKFSAMYGPQAALVKEVIELKNIAARTDASMSMLVKYFTEERSKKKDGGDNETDSGGIFAGIGAAILGLGSLIGNVVGSFGKLLPLITSLGTALGRIVPLFSRLGALLGPVLGVLLRFAPLLAVVGGGVALGKMLGDKVAEGLGWKEQNEKAEKERLTQEEAAKSPDYADKTREMEKQVTKAQFEAIPMLGQEKKKKEILQSGDYDKMSEQVEAYRETLEQSADNAAKRELQRLDSIREKTVENFTGVEQRTSKFFEVLKEGLAGIVPGAENLNGESIKKLLGEATTIDFGNGKKLELLNVGDMINQGMDELTKGLQEDKQSGASMNISQNNVTQNTVGGASPTQFISARPDTGNSGMEMFRRAIPIN